MLNESHLKDLLAEPSQSITDKLLLCLATQNASAKSVKEIKTIAKANGWRVSPSVNVSLSLRRSKGKAINAGGAWELTTPGRNHVASLAGPLASAPVPQIATSLRTELSKISDPQTVAFVEEAIECFERKLYRSAVVLSWVGALSVIQTHVVAKHLKAFNAEALRRDTKWKTAKNKDDLSRMKEYDFLQILEHLSVLGKNVKQELEERLKLRNGCGHPNSLVISENTVASHIEILILNVFAKF